MEKAIISWLTQNQIKSEAGIDTILGPCAYFVAKDGYIIIAGANTVFKKFLGWNDYIWAQGMYIEHIMPVDARESFIAVLDEAKEKLWTGCAANSSFKTRGGVVLHCKAHVFCVEASAEEAKYVVRLEYNKQEQIMEKLFSCALKQSGANCWYWDMSLGTATFINSSISPGELSGLSFMDEKTVFFEDFPQGFIKKLNFGGSYRDAFMEFIRRLLSKKSMGDNSVEMAFSTEDERLVWVSFTAEVIRNEKGIPQYAMGIWRNITEEKDRDQQQQHNKYMLDSMVKGSIYDITVNLDKNFCVADNSLEKWMEETRVFSPFYDQSMRELAVTRVVEKDRKQFLDFFNLEVLRSLPEDENFSLEYQRKYNGHNHWFKVNINIFTLDEFSDKWMYALVYDIDASKQRELMLERMAATDALTGLYNRGYSIELMEEYIQKHPEVPTAVVYMDLDNFKSVNDTLGHAAGDSMLICVADAMRSYFGNDAVLGRIGGDEFIMMCLHADKSLVGQMMESFVSYVGDKCHAECPMIAVTVSLGYVLYPDFGDNISVLADFADKALYRAKKHGKNMALKYDLALAQEKN